MKILHVIDSEGFYGAETVLVDLVAEQENNGVQATILNMQPCPDGEQSLEAEALKQGLHFHVIALRAGLDIRGALRIVRYAMDNHFDIIHSHGYKANILLGPMPRWLRKLPIVATLHGWCSTKRFTKLWLFEQLDRLSLKFMDAVVVVNQAMSKHPYLQSQRLKIQVVNNGIPAIYFDSSCLDIDITKFCSDSFVLGAIGRLSKEKGFDDLLDALFLLLKKGISARLVIIGEGPERENLEDKIKGCGLEEYVLLAGYRQSARNYIQLFHVFVMPSLSEGLPITLLEAMQARVPIVATEVGGVPQVLNYGNAGMLVPAESAEKLFASILKCTNSNSGIDEMVNSAYERAMEFYASRGMADLYQEIYTKVI